MRPPLEPGRSNNDVRNLGAVAAANQSDTFDFAYGGRGSGGDANSNAHRDPPRIVVRSDK